MRVGWLTDCHFDCIKDVRAFGERHRGTYDCVILTGDISNGQQIEEHLKLFSEGLGSIPIYFVTGNHDAWGTSILDLETKMEELPDPFVYLTTREPVKFTDDIALIGVGGWGDARWGLGEDSTVVMNDFYRVRELRASMMSSHKELFRTLRWIADRDAAKLRGQLHSVIRDGFKRVLVATHVPPFPKAAWHKGQASDANYSAHFACRATGDALVDFSHDHKDVSFLVICGHSHGRGEYNPLPNLRVLTGGAEYGQPAFQDWDVLCRFSEIV